MIGAPRRINCRAVMGAALIAGGLMICWKPAAAEPIGSDSLGDAPYLQRGAPITSEHSAAVTAFETGLAELKNGDLDAAARDFSVAAEAAPKTPGPWIGLAEVAMRRADRATAEADLKKALELAPDSAFVHSARAKYLAITKDYPAALDELDNAARLAPRWAVPHDQEGDIYLNALHNPERAITAYRKALAIDAKDSGAHLALGIALLQTGKPSDAKAELVEATRLAPKNSRSWVILGEVEAKLGERDAALAAFDAALSIEPSLPPNIGRGDILASEGKTEEAIAAYQAALQIDPRSVQTLDRLAAAQQVAKDPSEAEKNYRAALAIDSNDSIATNNLAFLLAEEKRDLDYALDLASKAVVSSSRAPSSLDTLAWVHRARGEFPKAAAILQSLVETSASPDFFYHLGVVYAEMGKSQDAKSAFDGALKIDPAYTPALEARRKLAP